MFGASYLTEWELSDEMPAKRTMKLSHSSQVTCSYLSESGLLLAVGTLSGEVKFVHLRWFEFGNQSRQHSIMVKSLIIPYTQRQIISVAPDQTWAFLMHLKPQGKFTHLMKALFALGAIIWIFMFVHRYVYAWTLY